MTEATEAGPAAGTAGVVAGSAAHAGGMAGLARRGLGSLLGAAVGAVATFGLTVVVTRGVDLVTAGAFFAATSLFLVAANLSTLGTQTGLVYFVARSGVDDGYARARSWLRLALPPVIVASIVLAALLVLGAEPLSQLVDQGAPAAEQDRLAKFLRVLAVALPLVALYETVIAATRGFHTVRPTTLIERVGRPSAQLVLALAAVSIGGSLLLPIAFALPYAVLLVVAVWWLHRLVQPYPSLPGAHRGNARQFWGYTAPRGLAGLGQLALQRLDIVLVAVMLDLVSAAIYTAGTRFVALSQLGSNAVAMTAQPKLASLLAIGDRPAARAVYEAATAWVVLVTWPVHLGVIALAPQAVGIFGDGYAEAAPVIVILASAMLVATGCGMVNVVLVMAGKTWWNLANVGTAVALTAIIDIILLPRIGIVGAAIGWATALVVTNLVPLYQIWRHLGLHPFGRATLTAYGLAGGCLGVVPLTGRLLGGDTGALAGFGIGVLLYAAGVWRERKGLQLAGLLRSRASR